MQCEVFVHDDSAGPPNTGYDMKDGCIAQHNAIQ